MYRYICLLFLFLPGCVAVSNDGALLAPSDETMELRVMQTRSFDTLDERRLLQASAQVLQDLGFTITESETKLGLIAAEKDRSARDTTQMSVAFSMAILGGLTGQKQDVIYDDKQKIWVSLVASPIAKSKRINIRINFSRIVWNNKGQISKRQVIKDADIYREFFNKLEQSVFLTANEI